MKTNTWRWILIVGWFVCAWLAFFDLPKETYERICFVCCLLLVGHNVEKLIDGE